MIQKDKQQNIHTQSKYFGKELFWFAAVVRLFLVVLPIFCHFVTSVRACRKLLHTDGFFFNTSIRDAQLLLKNSRSRNTGSSRFNMLELHLRN